MLKIPEKVDITRFPDKSGVYIMKDINDKIIYVGKAINLKKRVSSYFYSKQKDPKTLALVSNIDNIEYIVTDNEMEALVLESNLIKKHKPKYNIALKYGDGYPWIKVTTNEPFPRVYTTRRRFNDGAKYFGPYVSYNLMNEHIRIINILFPIRKCNKKLPSNNPNEKVCFNYHIKKCDGVCIGKIDEQTYRKDYINPTLLFLSGKYKVLINELEAQMNECSKNLLFEKAAKLRDCIEVVKGVVERQKVYIDESSDLDIIGSFKFENATTITNLHLREGKLIAKDTFTFEDVDSIEELLEDFIVRYYENVDFIPPEVLTDIELQSVDVLNQFLTEKRGKKAVILLPKIGQKAELVEMANKNAKFSIRAEKKITNKELILVNLKNILSLKKEPRRIEGFDIGNLLGKLAYASCVSFFNGKPDKKNYRIFGIKSISTPNDYEMMREAVARRYQRLKNENKEFPDLILIDGGKGQLNAAKSMLDALELSIPICSLAKKEEEIFLPDKSEPIRLEKNNDALRLLQSVRDEAHRFCNSFHRKKRNKKSVESILEKIEGVGERRRKALYKTFKTLDNIRKATIKELEEVETMNISVAKNIYDFFHKEPESKR